MLVTELVSLEALREGIAHATDGVLVGLLCYVGFEVAAQFGASV